MNTTATTSIPVAPPRAWFENPNLRALTPLTIEPSGRIFGHLASWKTCHMESASLGSSCTTAPRSRSGYAAFMTGAVLTAEGATLPTGPIVMSAPHADPAFTLAAALQHYGNSARAVADVRVGEDAHGIWLAGALRPTVTPEQVRELRGSSLSGDWRTYARTGTLELVAALAVNAPGFAIERPRALVASLGGGHEEVRSMLAVGVVERREERAARTGLLRGLYLDVLAMEVGYLPRRAGESKSRALEAMRGTYEDALIASMSAPGAQVQPWVGVLGVEGLPTGDGRLIAPDSLSAARYPLPLRWAPVDNGGHDGAVIVGRIDGLQREASGAITGWGVIDLGSAAGREAARLIGGNFLSGVSFDLDSTELSDETTAPGGAAPDALMVTSAARIRAATLVAIPAFDEARVELAGEPGYDAFALQPPTATVPLPCGCDSTIQTTIAPATPALT